MGKVEVNEVKLNEILLTKVKSCQENEPANEMEFQRVQKCIMVHRLYPCRWTSGYEVFALL